MVKIYVNTIRGIGTQSLNMLQFSKSAEISIESISHVLRTPKLPLRKRKNYRAGGSASGLPIV
jgi:hypothetical protein